MLNSLKHISPKTKILFVVFILILLPGAILSYLGLQSIDQSAENLRTKYLGTLNLVRDKLENEIIQLEENLRNSLIEVFPTIAQDNDLKELLRTAESDNPGFEHLFLINTDGGLISSTVALGWKKLRNPPAINNTQIMELVKFAEKAEYINKDIVNAIALYKKALIYAISRAERSLLLSRIGRCYFKIGEIQKGINEYKKILRVGNEEFTIGNVPASIVALSQIAGGYETLNVSNKQLNFLMQLYRRLLEKPWDLSGGDFLYYLKIVSSKIQTLDLPESNFNAPGKDIEDLIKQESKLLEEIRFIEFVYQDIVQEISSALRSKSFSELRPQHIFRKENGKTIQLGYIKLPYASQHTQLLALGYQIKEEYILSKVLSELSTRIDLGRDVFVGILNESDSLIYPGKDHTITNYLVAANFSKLFVDWKVALFDQDGKSIEELVGRKRQVSIVLFSGIILIMLVGIIFTIRAVVHESEVSRIRSEFVSNVSHELKTPLALIRMFGETLDTGLVTDEKKRREFYSIIRKESERLTHLINNVLDFSKVESGTKEYNFEEADLIKIVRDSLEAYKFHIRDLGFEIKSKLSDNLVVSKIDKDAISQVLLNLLSNAVKYSNTKKYIYVEVSKNSTWAQILISDHGIGMSKEQLKKIFDKFYRVPTPEVKKARGSGLGLTLTKHIIDAHGGSIEVESEFGKGSTFIIRIPL
jgi:signal transduction histidine kinase